MTISNFKARIYGFINRGSSLFTTTESASIDQVLYCLNDARRIAQNSHMFEINRGDVFLSTSEVGANWMTGCKTTPGGATAVLMNRVDSVWNFSTSTVSAGTLYRRTSQLWYKSVHQFEREIGRDDGALWEETATTTSSTIAKFAYHNGATLHVTGIDEATNYLLNGIKFLDDVGADPHTDPFLTYFPDWLTWATLVQLNQFLKDDMRINIDMAFVDRLWQTVKEKDGQIANAGDISSLD